MYLEDFVYKQEELVINNEIISSNVQSPAASTNSVKLNYGQ